MDTKTIYCLTPVYNDWRSCHILLQKINELNKLQDDYTYKVIIVNDGSVLEPHTEFELINAEVIDLKINVGHQRAIAAGLQYIYNEKEGYNYVVVLDSDGEDKPEDIPELLKKSKSTRKIVFAQRRTRQETKLFKAGYFFYRHLFRLLTGQKISFGNFSIIPVKMLNKVAYLDNIWNHYSGAIIQSKIPFETVLLDRGKRYEGKSKMNFNSLVLHGLSSIAVYFDFLSIRILTFSLYGIGVCSVAVLYILFQKLFTDKAIPGWASSLILIIMGIILQLFLITLIVLLMQLSTRKNINAPNSRRYLDFIDREQNQHNNDRLA